MSTNRIKAILLQEFYITKHSLEVNIDLFFFSAMNIVMFGLFASFLSGSSNGLASKYLMFGILLWEIVRVTQYSMSVGSLWNIWSRNLSNMFIAPLSLTEYIVAQILSSVIKAMVIFCMTSLLAAFAFHENILTLGLFNLFLYFINLLIFAWTIGIIILGFIFRYGQRIQAIAWGAVVIFQPLCAMFFPLHILPGLLQIVARFFPATYIFEAARQNIISTQTDWSMIVIAFGENIIYFILSLLLFRSFYNKSKETGQFAHNEG